MENLKEGYNNTEIGVIPEDWEVVKLGDIFEIKAGGDISKDGVSKERKGKYIYPIYANSVSEKGLYGYTDTFKIDKPCITVTARGNLGVAIARFERFYPIIRLLILIPKKEVNLIFCEHQINRINILNESTGVPQLTVPQMATYKIPLPPLPEQKKISKILSTWDNAIEKLEKLINKKIEYKKGLMQKLLSGELRFPEFKEDWEEVKLEDIVIKMKSGGTPKSTNKEYYNNGTIPFVKVNDMTKNGKYLKETEIKITEKGLKNSSVWLVPKNNILYSMYASIGFVSINKIEVETNQAIMCIIPNNEIINTEFLYYMLDDYRKHTIRFIEQGTQGNLNAKIIKNFKFKIPPLQEQQKIAEILTLQDKEIQLNKNKLKLLKEQKKGLMQNLLTGKIRVKT